MAVKENRKVSARVHDSLARAYTTLGRLFLEIPAAELLSSARAELASIHEGVGTVFAEVAKEMERLCESMSQPLVDIKADNAQLFAGVKKLPAPPWESCYLSGKRQVYTAVTEQVRRAYLDAHLAQEPSEAQPDDHIGLELQFLGAMSGRIADALDDGDFASADVTSAQRSDFLTEHLVRWGLAFCGDLEKAAHTEFYRSLARLTAGFINYEMKGDILCSE